MTRDDLVNDIWVGLPMLRRNLLGKHRVQRFVELAVAESPLEVLRHVQSGGHQADIVSATWKGSVKKGYCVKYGDDSVQFGPLFWIIAIPIIQYVVKRLMERWFGGGSQEQLLIASWKRELNR